MQRVIEFVLGLTFGLGLLISGMTDPGKVQGFLDLAGAWDPSLAFVMGGAIACVGLAGIGARWLRTQLRQVASQSTLRPSLPGFATQ